tara:strand:- start:314 stop:664 length:351 start_codon:yes stop_codon:yes gene_type:complete
MDIGIELLVNKNKIKKKTYLIGKKPEEFTIVNFIYETVLDELKIDLETHPKELIEKIIDITLKISNEDKTIDISHLEKFKKNKKFNKPKEYPIKNLIVSSLEEKHKESKVEVKKLT